MVTAAKKKPEFLSSCVVDCINHKTFDNRKLIYELINCLSSRRENMRNKSKYVNNVLGHASMDKITTKASYEYWSTSNFYKL